MLARVALVLLLCASHATGETLARRNCGPAKPAKKLSSLRDVDWCNFDFALWKGKMREGHSSVHLYADLGEPHDTITATLRGVIYGDFDGDKRPDAAVVIERSTWIGRTGDHSGSTSVYVYKLVGGKATRLGSIPAGTPVDAITIRKGIVAVTSGPANAKTTMRFHRVNDDFIEVPATK
jgi:hypothetical protein